MNHHVVVVGGGITGLATAFSILVNANENISVSLFEASSSTGGLIRTSPFAGLDAVDEGADSFLMRVPFAHDLAREVGLAGALTSPTSAHAAVWHERLHPIPPALVLGVPAGMSSIAFGSLLSPSAKLRAALDIVLPPRKTEHDCIGAAVRARFGRQVNERLVDPLIGSIYAADTDNFSLEAVPQVASLATERSMLLAARKTRASVTATGPVFAAPLRGMGALTSSVRERIESFGGHIHTGARVTSVTQGDAGRYSVAYVDEGGHTQVDAHAVVLATPARHTADIVRSLDKEVADYLSTRVHASVALITVHIPKNQWKSSLNGSGYLVPKPDQRWVTAASFGSNKWAHWVPSDDSVILRVSLGRDGLDVMHHDDQTLVNLMLADLKHHLGVDLEPIACRISRWPESFPQYRPYHFAALRRAEQALASAAPGVFLAGASYRGIGIPACVQQARSAAAATLEHVGSTRS